MPPGFCVLRGSVRLADGTKTFFIILSKLAFRCVGNEIWEEGYVKRSFPECSRISASTAGSEHPLPLCCFSGRAPWGHDGASAQCRDWS